MAAAPAHAQFGKLLNRATDKANAVLSGKPALSNEDIGQALKVVLDQGVSQAVSSLSATDGYFGSPYKIFLPQETQQVIHKVSGLPGFGSLEADLTERVNRAAEAAATHAGPVFVDAIRSLTIDDARQLLLGEEDAATRFLEKQTGVALTTAFLPVIHTALEEVKANELWHKATTAYNRLPLVKKMEPELDAYVTHRALEGMFALIEIRESELRQNPTLRNTELLRRVFTQQD